jgi:hypothetical protein
MKNIKLLTVFFAVLLSTMLFYNCSKESSNPSEISTSEATQKAFDNIKLVNGTLHFTDFKHLEEVLHLFSEKLELVESLYSKFPEFVSSFSSFKKSLFLINSNH